MKTINIIFFGTPLEVLPILEKLHTVSWINISAVITQPDKPIGRKKILTPSPIRMFAHEHNLPVFTPQKLKYEFQEQCKNIKKPDIAVLAAYGKIIPQWLLEWPNVGILNIHPSLLPHYRGATPTLGPLLRGESETGITYMLMDQELDHGPIIAQIHDVIRPKENREQLTSRLLCRSAEYVPTVIHHLAKTSSANPYPELKMHTPPQIQNHSQATFCPILDKQDGYFPIELIKAAIEGQSAPLDLFPTKIQALIRDIYQPLQVVRFVYQSIQALNNWPGVWTIISSKRVKIIAASINKNHLQIETVQPEGKNPMPWEQYLQNNQI